LDVGLDALGDVDMLCPSGAVSKAESGVDGLATATHTSTVPIMASPRAIEALTRRLGCQRDERNISFDPSSIAVGTNPPHSMRERL
jgi:hypothetical protein